eukprot:606801-Pelagomonas_calceolata.AAC.7
MGGAHCTENCLMHAADESSSRGADHACSSERGERHVAVEVLLDLPCLRAQAVTEFGREGGQVELQLDTASAISVANVTWDVIWSVEAQPQSFPQGNLLITAAPSEDGRPAVLDAAMKSGLAPGDTEQTVTWRVGRETLPVANMEKETYWAQEAMNLLHQRCKKCMQSSRRLVVQVCICFFLYFCFFEIAAMVRVVAGTPMHPLSRAVS